MSYYANTDLDAYAMRLANYNTHHAAWADEQGRSAAAYEQAHAAWEANPTDENGDPNPEPQPQAIPEPQPPEPPTVTYEATQVQSVTTIETATGPALIVPGRYIVEGGGVQFSIDEAELNAGYTDTTEALPT